MTDSRARPTDRAETGGFTLIELLAAITIVALLAALIFPSVGAARDAANRARTRAQFSQWAAAIESFRAEYGHYPAFDASALVNGGASTAPAGEHLFHDLLAGRRRDGGSASADAATAAGAQNRRRIAFHAFADAEFAPADAPLPHLLRDACENLSIAVLVDRNLDGRIDAGDYATWPAVATRDGALIRPGPPEVPEAGVRAGVIFYSADPRATAEEPRFIWSWR
jgi:prepilin-type N-terminal cleavage/methylation domain-containing protein